MTENKLVKRYVTKYALTEGVKFLNGRILDEKYFMEENDFSDRVFAAPAEHYDSWEEAKRKAESMREKKIASLRAQITKLEAMVFVKPEGGVE